MKTTSTHELTVAALRSNSGFIARFEDARVRARDHLCANGLPTDLLTGDVKEVLRIAHCLDDKALEPLIREGVELIRFQSTRLDQLPQKLATAESEGLRALSYLKLPTEIPREEYISDAEAYLGNVDRAIEDAREKKRIDEKVTSRTGQSPFALKVALLRGLPFTTDRVSLSLEGTSMLVLVQDAGWNSVMRAEVSINNDRKVMTIQELDAGSTWSDKGIGTLFVRNLFEVAGAMGMREVALGGGKSNGARFWALLGGDIADITPRWDRDMHGFAVGSPYWGLSGAASAIKENWTSLGLAARANNVISACMARYDDRVKALDSETASQFIRDIAADRGLLQSSGEEVGFGRFFFEQTGLRFSYIFDLQQPETWQRIYGYSYYALAKRKHSLSGEL
jgi:hypothetical protein